MFEYMTAQEAAEKWNVSLRWGQRLCKGNRIEGAMNINRVWLIQKMQKSLPIQEKRIFREFQSLLAAFLTHKVNNATCSLHLEHVNWWYFSVQICIIKVNNKMEVTNYKYSIVCHLLI